jgi:hypothetical protein
MDSSPTPFYPHVTNTNLANFHTFYGSLRDFYGDHIADLQAGESYALDHRHAHDAGLRLLRLCPHAICPMTVWPSIRPRLTREAVLDETLP